MWAQLAALVIMVELGALVWMFMDLLQKTALLRQDIRALDSKLTACVDTKPFLV